MLGQVDLQSGSANAGGLGAHSLSWPMGLAMADDGRLLVADSGNGRVLAYEPGPDTTGTSATGLLGQVDFTHADKRVAQDRLAFPAGVAVGAGKVAVVDRDGHRVLIYDQLPGEGFVPVPSVVIGQPDFESNAIGCGPQGLFMPIAVSITPSGRLIVVDQLNSRVLVWDRIPTEAPPAPVPTPTLVLGQFDLEHCTDNDDDHDDRSDDQPTARTLAFPVDAWSDDRVLVVADTGNNRVLVWNGFPQASFEAADVVLGHFDAGNRRANSEHLDPGSLPKPTARTLSGPQGVHSDGTSLAVADTYNNRVLVWNTLPTSNGAAADRVLGHAGFDAAASNDADGDALPDAPTAQVFKRPARVLLAPDRLFVSDGLHNRVLLFRR